MESARTFKQRIEFEIDPLKIDLLNLRTKEVHDFNMSDYLVVPLNLSKVVDSFQKVTDDEFSKEVLFKGNAVTRKCFLGNCKNKNCQKYYFISQLSCRFKIGLVCC